MLIKISDDTAAKLGIDSQDKALGILEDASELASQLQAAVDEKDAMNASIEELKGRLDAIEERLAAAKDKDPEAVDESVEAELESMRQDIITDAVAEATRAAMAVVAGVGPQAVPVNKEPADVTGEQAPAADDYEGQWKANPAIAKEFTSFERYAAYKRAMASGTVRLFDPKNK